MPRKIILPSVYMSFLAVGAVKAILSGINAFLPIQSTFVIMFGDILAHMRFTRTAL